MSENFTKKIYSGGMPREFDFMKVFYGPELRYHVRFINTEQNNKQEVFRMYWEENGYWKIASQVLPKWIFESERDYNDAIEENS
jgi:hypothetical protein